MTAKNPNTKNLENTILLRRMVNQQAHAFLDQGEQDKAAAMMEARRYLSEAIFYLHRNNGQNDLDAAGAYLDRAKAILKGVA